MPTIRDRDAKTSHRDFRKITISAAGADKRRVAPLLKQKQPYLSRWIDLSSPCAAEIIENPDVEIVRAAGRDGANV